MARRIFGWHTPDEYAEADIICRPLFVPLPFVHIVGGAIAELTWLRNWEPVGTMTPKRATEIMTVMLKDWYQEDCMACCPLRINPQTGGLEFSEDNGETWTPVGYGPNDPIGGTITFPDPAPQPEGTDDEQRCIAAANATLVLQMTYHETVQVLVEGIGSAVLGLVRALSLIVDGLLGGRGAITSLIAAAIDIISESDEFVPDGFPDESLEAVQNILFCAATATDDVVTFDYATVISAFEAEGIGVEPYPGLIVLLQLVLGEAGLNTAGGVPAATDPDCSGANCIGPWCYVENLGLADTPWELGPPGTQGTHNVGFGFDPTFADVNSKGVISIERTFATPIHINKVTFRFQKNGAGPNNSNNIWLKRNGVNVATNFDNPQGVGLEKVINYTGEIDYILWQTNSGTAAPNNYRLENVEFEGEVTNNPFGNTNC